MFPDSCSHKAPCLASFSGWSSHSSFRFRQKKRNPIIPQGVFMNSVMSGKPAKPSVRKRLCPRTSNVSSNFSFLQDIMPLYEIYWLEIHLQWSLVLWHIFIFNIIIYCDSILYYFLPEIMTCVYEIQSLYIKHILWWENHSRNSGFHGQTQAFL